MNFLKVLAIIPARGGSKGVPRKNIKLVNGKPLIAYSIEEAKKSNLIDRIIVSTEDDEIAKISEQYGAEIINRPKELSQDSTSTIPVLKHALDCLEKENYKPDLILLIPATSPLRKKTQIEEAIEKLIKNNYDSLISVSFIYKHRYEISEDGLLIPITKERLNRQERKPVILENGALYISRRNLIEKGKIVGGKIGFIEMSMDTSVNIDEPADFFIAEQFIIKNQKNEQ